MFSTCTKDSNLLFARLFGDKDDFARSIFVLAISNISFKNIENALITLPKDFKNVQSDKFAIKRIPAQLPSL